MGVLERVEMDAFLTLAEELHFSRTAERLGVTPGRISQTIKKLERRIGGPLFERTSRRVRLTPLGERLRDNLLPAHRQIRHAVEDARTAARGITGELRVGFTTAWTGCLVQRVVDAFGARHPACTVGIREAHYNDTFTMLRAGELDLIVGEVEFAEGPDVTVGPVLISCTRALVVPADHPLAKEETVCREDFARAPLIRAIGLSPSITEGTYPSRTPSGRPVQDGGIAHGWQEMLTMIGAGKGVTIVSIDAAQFHSRPDVAFVPFRDAPPIEYALIWRTGRSTPAIEAFGRAAVEIALP